MGVDDQLLLVSSTRLVGRVWQSVWVSAPAWVLVSRYSSPHFSFFTTSTVTIAIHAMSDASEKARLRPVGKLASQRPISISGTVGMTRASSRSTG